MKALIDPHGRSIHKIRLSLLDACNFRCRYCMPNHPKFLPKDKLLSRSEILRLMKILNQQGMDELRLTGGEPTLRSDFMDIVRDLSELSYKKLGLTTNGLHLAPLLPQLKKTALKNINFSLDSLNKKGFAIMTGVDGLEKVMISILSAKELGFNVKINMVMMKGFNAKELFDFIEFSAEFDIEVRFLELMRIGVVRADFDNQFISADAMLAKLAERYSLNSLPKSIDATSFNYRLNNGAHIGFIASETKPFCSGCSRMRISADGIIRPCLMMNEGFSLKNKNEAEVLEILHRTMGMKPTERIFEVEQSMNEIGG